MRNSPLTPSIHVIDDDSLLNVFYLYRPFLFGQDDDYEGTRVFGMEWLWDRGRWWYKLAHVCQRWRNVVLGSAAYLGLSLVCTNGTPIADMMAHSISLPLVIDYSLGPDDDITPEDEEGAILALKQYDRVRRVRLRMPPTSLHKLIVAMDDEYPILEHLILIQLTWGRTISVSPETLRAPHMRHLVLMNLALPIRSRLLSSAVGLVTLSLTMIHPSTYFYPNTLLQWLSFMPRLKTLLIRFLYPDPEQDVEGQLTHMPIVLPNLHSFKIRGVKSYLEVLLHRITAPRLEKFLIEFADITTLHIPRLLPFVSTTNLRFKTARVEFYNEAVNMYVYPHEEAETYALSIIYWYIDLGRQVRSTAQTFGFLSPMFSTVDHLTLEHEAHTQAWEDYNKTDRTEWRKLFNSFRNLKTLRVAEGLVEELTRCRCLQLDDGELPLEVLPELQELTYSGSGDTGGAFTSFIDARQNTGRPITLIRS
jgi:hypothetical protein